MPTSTTTASFQNPAASVSYSGAAFVRIDWASVPASVAELREVYEQALLIMKQRRVAGLMSVHNQRPPMPLEIQTWLAQQWIPRAITEAGYSHCAIVESANPLSRLAARTVGANLNQPLLYRFVMTVEEAAQWLSRK